MFHVSRQADLAALAADTFDLLVIGGGITGAGVARDAAMRGLRTALVDASDFAAATSGKSSRLIHGGLRYLEHGWFRLVLEASRERRVLLRIAPHLVRAQPFTFPAFRGGRVRRWHVSAAVLLYDLLALFRNVRRHRWLSRHEVLRSEPRLREVGLTGGARYWDARCEDARLTLATVRSAQRHGARCLNYVRVLAFERATGRVRGAICEDVETGARLPVHAHAVVNATGPWVDAVRRLDDPGAKPLLRPTKGAHIVVPRARLGNAGAVTLVSPVDGRVMFALPWEDTTIVGTTDTDCGDAPEDLEPDAADVIYLLRSANALFPDARLQFSDVLCTFAALRPLLAAPAATPSSVPREHAIQESASGLVTVAGGKLTTYRVMAAQTVDCVAARLRALDGRRVPRRAATDVEPLPGGEVADLDLLVAELAKDGQPAARAAHLVARYGTEAAGVANVIDEDPDLTLPLALGSPDLRGEVVYQARRESARTVADVLIRRTGLFYRRADQAMSATADVALLLARELGWDDARRSAAVAEYTAAVARMRRALTPSDG